MTIQLRPAVPGDEAFVETVYFATQRWIIEQLFGWRGDDFERQRLHENHDFARVQIIEVDAVPAGWIAETAGQDAIEIGGIYILPDQQRNGIGTGIISSIIREAESLGVPVRLSTARINPAKALYERLGFSVVGENVHKIFMERASLAFGPVVYRYVTTLVPPSRVCDEAWPLGEDNVDYLAGIGVLRNYGGQVMLVPQPHDRLPHPRWPQIVSDLESKGYETDRVIVVLDDRNGKSHQRTPFPQVRWSEREKLTEFLIKDAP